jgi:hypothetical protein
VKILLLSFLIILSSCSQRIKVPINRFLSPEAIGGGVEIEYRDVGFSVGVLDFSNNSTENSLTMGTKNEEELYMAAGISPKVDLFVRVPKESSSLLGIKVQVLGTPTKQASAGHNLAFSMGMGSERDTFDQTFSIDLKSDVTDYSLIHGYRFSPMLMMYEGISISNYSFRGNVKGTHGLDSDDISYQAKNISGAHIGIVMGGSGFKLKLEYATQKIAWTHTEEKLFQHFGLAVSAGW